jgi:hypothetical protein
MDWDARGRQLSNALKRVPRARQAVVLQIHLLAELLDGPPHPCVEARWRQKSGADNNFVAPGAGDLAPHEFALWGRIKAATQSTGRLPSSAAFRSSKAASGVLRA